MFNFQFLYLSRIFGVLASCAKVTAVLCIAVSGSMAAAVSGNEDPREYIREQLKAGVTEIVVPSGTYRLMQDADVFLRLQNISDTTIDFTGVTFIGLAHTTMLDLVNCRNLTIKGLVIDYDPLPYTQGIIRDVGHDGSWIVEIIEGYAVDGIRTNADVDMRIQAYDPGGIMLTNPLRYGNGAAIERISDRMFKVTGGGERSGRIGDIAVFNVLSYNPAYGYKQGAVVSSGCEGVRFEDVTLRSAAFMGFVSRADNRTVYLRCVLDRCLPEDDYQERGMKRLRSLNVDGFHIKNNIVGPRIEDCVARYMADDCINISGMYSLVSETNGNEIRIISSFYEDPDIHPGEVLEIMTSAGNSIVGAKVLSIRRDGRITSDEQEKIGRLPLVSFYRDPQSPYLKHAYRVTLDRQVNVGFGDVVISAGRVGNGFVIKGNTFGPIRSRPILIKASDGTIANNTITGAGSEAAIKIGPEYYWMEGSCGSNIKIENNLIENSSVPAVYVGGQLSGSHVLMPANSRSDIQILGNTIRNITAPAIVVHGCTDLVIENNKLSLRGTDTGKAMDLQNVKNASLRNNGVDFIKK